MTQTLPQTPADTPPQTLVERRFKGFTSVSLKTLGATLLVAAALALSPAAQAEQPAWEAFLPKAGEVGSGQLRWWGFLVYDASLWSPDGAYKPGGPFALSLRYARDISRKDIVEASIDQMRDLGFPVDKHPEWKAKLDQVMVSVKSGRHVNGRLHPGPGRGVFS